jgi:hypothetical protein
LYEQRCQSKEATIAQRARHFRKTLNTHIYSIIYYTIGEGIAAKEAAPAVVVVAIAY